MNIFLDKSYRIYIILLGIITAIVIYAYVINPYIFKPLCITDSENCYKIKYRLGSNGDALINVSPGNNWYVYSDYKIYVYTPYDSYYCKTENLEQASPATHSGAVRYSPVYVIDTKNNKISETGTIKVGFAHESAAPKVASYKCILNLDDMIKKYENAPEKTLYYRSLDKEGIIKPLNVYDIFNILYEKEILY